MAYPREGPQTSEVTTWRDAQDAINKQGLEMVKEALKTLPEPILARLVDRPHKSMAQEIRERKAAKASQSSR